MKAIINYNEPYGYQVDLILEDKEGKTMKVHTKLINKSVKQWGMQQALLKQEYEKNKSR